MLFEEKEGVKAFIFESAFISILSLNRQTNESRGRIVDNPRVLSMEFSQDSISRMGGLMSTANLPVPLENRAITAP
jgi:hypothetical protein